MIRDISIQDTKLEYKYTRQTNSKSKGKALVLLLLIPAHFVSMVLIYLNNEDNVFEHQIQPLDLSKVYPSETTMLILTTKLLNVLMFVLFGL